MNIMQVHNYTDYAIHIHALLCAVNRVTVPVIHRKPERNLRQKFVDKPLAEAHTQYMSGTENLIEYSCSIVGHWFSNYTDLCYNCGCPVDLSDDAYLDATEGE